jgi:hypothetical protein
MKARFICPDMFLGDSSDLGINTDTFIACFFILILQTDKLGINSSHLLTPCKISSNFTSDISEHTASSTVKDFTDFTANEGSQPCECEMNV